MERTLVLIKPDGVERGLVGKVIERYENKGCKIAALKLLRLSKEKAEEHYFEHQGRPFFPAVIEYLCSGPLVALVLEGEDIINVIRKLHGATDPKEAEPGTIRGDLAYEMSANLVHASDSLANAEREITIFFSSEEIFA